MKECSELMKWYLIDSRVIRLSAIVIWTVIATCFVVELIGLILEVHTVITIIQWSIEVQEHLITSPIS